MIKCCNVKLIKLNTNYKNVEEMLLSYLNFLLAAVTIETSLAAWFPSPTFVNTPTNITVVEGKSAFLPCGVANLGDRSVTWMYRKNLHIISAGMLTYSPDNRYKVLHPSNTNEWTLHIRNIMKSDQGKYECQVNSDQKITRLVRLFVNDKNMDDPFYILEFDASGNDTTVDIDGPLERYIQAGSILGITCTIFHARNSGPKFVTWYHGGRKMQYNSSRGGISLQIDKSTEKTISKLYMAEVTPLDSGRYTCRPQTGGHSSVTVHVKSGQYEAAVQQSGYAASSDNFNTVKLTIVIYFLFTYVIKV